MQIGFIDSVATFPLKAIWSSRRSTGSAPSRSPPATGTRRRMPTCPPSPPPRTTGFRCKSRRCGLALSAVRERQRVASGRRGPSTTRFEGWLNLRTEIDKPERSERFGFLGNRRWRPHDRVGTRGRRVLEVEGGDVVEHQSWAAVILVEAVPSSDRVAVLPAGASEARSWAATRVAGARPAGLLEQWATQLDTPPSSHTAWFNSRCIPSGERSPAGCATGHPFRVTQAAVTGTAWLTAYRMLFVKSGLRPGQTML